MAKPASKLSNRDLKNTFLLYNERFFDNRLDNSTQVVFDYEMDEEGSDGECDGDTIRIAESLRNHGDLAILVLLHEMNHLNQPENIGIGEDPDHGMRFQHGTVELFLKGAYEGLL